jgi:hypothetical protein
VLRSELTRELGVRWLSVWDGIAEIAGVPMPVLKEFSRRRADIEAALEQSGTSGPRASEAAALATRQAKDRRTSLQALQRNWHERATARGFARDELRRSSTVDDLARDVAEQRHAIRPGLDERIEGRRRAEQRDRNIEREMKRSVSRGLER